MLFNGGLVGYREHQNDGRRGGNRDEIAVGVVWQLLDQLWRDGDRAGHAVQQRMIVLACHERSDADRTLRRRARSSTTTGLPHFLPKRIGEYSGRGIVGPSGRERDDQLDLPLGPIGTR